MKRRTLLSLLATASAYGALSGGLLNSNAHAYDSRRRQILILLELRGGNDGLNTLVPYRNRTYHDARPTLALKNSVPLTDELGVHPALAPLLPIWQKRRLGFVQGVGWSRPNRSHFKSADQWATANPSGEGPGWLAAAFDRGGKTGPLVALDAAGSPAMEGGNAVALQMSPAQLDSSKRTVLYPDLAGDNLVLRQMLALEQTGRDELEKIWQQLSPLPEGVLIPKGSLGQQIGLALRLISSSSCPPVLQLAQGGYDTHANQLVRHNRVLGDLAEALVALDTGLQTISNRPQVTLLGVSEFGRRLHENGSRGTDHGSASMAILYGDHIAEPIIGSYPSLERLDERGDLIPGLSPPQLYQRVLSQTFPGLAK